MAQTAPSQEELDRGLAALKEFAKEYVDRLPDFVGRRTTRHSMLKTGETGWTPQVKVVDETTYSKGHEHYQLV
jgi:hypothetical protein